MERKLRDQLDEVLCANYNLYRGGYMYIDNYNALISCLCAAFGTEIIARRMVELGLEEK